MINKVDRPGARTDWVINQTFDLFAKLGATDEQLDFPVVYASALNGFAMLDMKKPADTMRAVFETILSHVQPRKVIVMRLCNCKFLRWITPLIPAV